MIKRKKNMMSSKRRLKKMHLLTFQKEKNLKRMLTFLNLIQKISIKGLMRNLIHQSIFQTILKMMLITTSISQFLKILSSKNDNKTYKFLI